MAVAGGEVPTIAVTTTTQSLAYGAADAATTLVGINLTAAPAPEADSDRAAVQTVVVSDVSGSMGGPKMDLLRETGKMLLDEFVAKDKVGLVTFDTNVSEPLKLTPMTATNKTRAAAAVGKFRAGSQTNLSGGLFAGVQQLLDQRRSGGSDVKTVLLMTDGEANQGLRTSAQILPVLSNMLEGSGISLHTFGYGSNHNADLLRAIATAGNGSYYFVEGVDDIRGAFGDCLGGVLSVVAQNLELTIEAVNGATITKVHHKSAKAVEPGRVYTVRFADVYGEEQRDILADVTLPSGRPAVKDLTSAEAQVLKCSLRYVDVLRAQAGAAEASAAVLRPAGSLSAAARVAAYGPDNAHLELQSLRLRVAACLERARAAADGGNLPAGRAMVTAMQQEVANAGKRLQEARRQQEAATTTTAAAAGSGAGAGGASGGGRGGSGSGVMDEADNLLPSFAEDLAECLEGMREINQYRSVTSHKMAYMSEGHMQQRCMESASAPMRSAAGSSGGGSSSMRGNAYRTKAKMSKASKFSMF